MAFDLWHLLSYARQPLVGAFTGYVTTDVAIRLLFHPLKPWRVFGVRVPLTPGVFPAKRYEFAEKIGIMVGSHLFTSDDVRGALKKKEFRDELNGAVEVRIDRLLAKELGTLDSLFPEEFKKWVRDLTDRFRQLGMEEIYAYLESPGCEAEVQRLLRELGDALLSRQLHGFISQEQHDQLRVRLGDVVRDFLHSPEVGGALAGVVDRKVEEFFSSEKPVGAYLPRGSAEALASLLEGELQSAAEALTTGEEFREHLSRKIQESLKAGVASLQGIPGFFAKFIDPQWILSLFPDLTQKVEKEMAQWLKDERTQRQIARALKERVEVFLSRPWSELLSALPYRRVVALRRLIRREVLRMVRAPHLTDLLSVAVGEKVESLRELSLGEILGEVLSDAGMERMRELLAVEVLASLRSPAVRKLLEKTVSEKMEELLFLRPLGHISAFIPAHARDEISEAAFEQLAELLVKELPPLVDTLNIKKIVEDKVNALDIVQMEGLLLDIMKESFMFLNLFGAFLGFLIGIVNVILPGWGG